VFILVFFQGLLIENQTKVLALQGYKLFLLDLEYKVMLHRVMSARHWIPTSKNKRGLFNILFKIEMYKRDLNM
jgi:hypothetical protein